MELYDLSPQINYLSNVQEYLTRNIDSEQWLSNSLQEIKLVAVEQGLQELAKEIWCLQTIHQIQKDYLQAYEYMKQGGFYEAWCLLDKVSIKITFLEKHFVNPQQDQFKLSLIEKHIEQYRLLYPYKYFLSPAILQLEKKCSICGKKISIRSFCGHRKGDIYDGEMCVHEITNMQFLEISVVTNPVQKYSVLFIADNETGEKTDNYDYSRVKYVVTSLQNPFDEWDIQVTKIRHPHKFFSHISDEDTCPCGSLKSYGNCCKKCKEGVLRPHINIIFHVLPKDGPPPIIYPQYNIPKV
jgi:hypothetical protein